MCHFTVTVLLLLTQSFFQTFVPLTTPSLCLPLPLSPSPSLPVLSLPLPPSFPLFLLIQTKLRILLLLTNQPHPQQLTPPMTQHPLLQGPCLPNTCMVNPLKEKFQERLCHTQCQLLTCRYTTPASKFFIVLFFFNFFHNSRFVCLFLLMMY